MKKFIWPLFILAILFSIGFAIWTITKPEAQEGMGGRARHGHDSGPVPVKVITAERRTLPKILQSIGTVESAHRVEVRPQITGVLQEVLFQEGENVSAGQILFKIDPAALQAVERQAQANLAQAQAQAQQARAQSDRLAPLAQQEYVTRDEYEQARVTADTAAAVETASKAQLEQARIHLRYAVIRAPIAGRTGLLTVRAGNLISPGDAAPLVTINRLQPALVRFTVPQQNLDELRRYQAGGQMFAEILRAGSAAAVIDQGPLVFIDNQVDAQTGTITLKARVANTDEALLPGQFVAVRLVLAMEQDALVVPAAAVQLGQDGPYVYVADAGKARLQPISVARQMQDFIVVADGLRGDERIIIEHPDTLAAGMEVDVIPAGAASGRPLRKAGS